MAWREVGRLSIGHDPRSPWVSGSFLLAMKENCLRVLWSLAGRNISVGFCLTLFNTRVEESCWFLFDSIQLEVELSSLFGFRSQLYWLIHVRKFFFLNFSFRLKKRLGRWTVCINGYRLLKNTILNVGGGEHLFVSQEYLRQSVVQLFSGCYFWLSSSSKCFGWLWYIRFRFRVDAGEALIFPSLVIS